MRLTFVALFLLPLSATACLWDYDTLEQERSRFPDALELIVGKFPRHTPEYYEWRVKDRTAQLAARPDDATLYDDISVAYVKLGKFADAIEWGSKALAKFPTRYETLSNLGTFHFLAGKPEDAIPFIEKALKVNPDAHFGREKYQLLLAKFLLSKRVEGKVKFPLNTGGATFAAFIGAEDRSAAVKGVLGMMRFADHDSPLLLEALASLLGPDDEKKDAKQLAARAYLRAAEKFGGDAANAYHELARNALVFQTTGPNTTAQITTDVLERSLVIEVADAKTYSQTMFDRERKWISDGKNPDELFKAALAEPIPPVAGYPTPPSTPQVLTNPPRGGFGISIIAIAGVAVAAIFGLTFIYWMSGGRNEQP